MAVGSWTCSEAGHFHHQEGDVHGTINTISVYLGSDNFIARVQGECFYLRDGVRAPEVSYGVLIP